MMIIIELLPLWQNLSLSISSVLYAMFYNRLSEFVSPPSIVRELSWVSNYFPEQLPEDCTYTRPEVQKYCLMGVRDSFTDFHVDFGGTSVWYHILRVRSVSVNA